MSIFDTAFRYVVGEEGALSLDPNDDGNWTGGKTGLGVLKGTKYGISAAAYPTEDIANLTLDRAKVLYQRDYWNECSCDSWAPALAFCVFDCAVNQGVERAKECLQRAAGVADDGKIGPHTRDAVSRLEPSVAVEYFQAERILEYVQAAKWERYKRGWSRRVIQTAMTAMR